MSKLINKKTITLSVIIILIFTIIFIVVHQFTNNTTENIVQETSINQNIILTNNTSAINVEKNSILSNYFPDNITEIILINKLSDSSNPTTYIINDIEKIKTFIKFFTDYTWEENEIKASTNLQPVWIINIKGSTTTTFNMIRK